MDPVALLFVCGLGTAPMQACDGTGQAEAMVQSDWPHLPHGLATVEGRGKKSVAHDVWAEFVTEAAIRFAIPQSWIRAVMRAESGGPGTIGSALLTSRAGAMGLMQLMPETYQDMRLRYGLGPDPYDPHDNILAGAAYLREMFDRFGAPLFLAAYNAGPARLDRFLFDNKALPQETLRYVGKITHAIDLDAEPLATKPRDGERQAVLVRRTGSSNRTPHNEIFVSKSASIFVPLSAGLSPNM